MIPSDVRMSLVSGDLNGHPVGIKIFGTFVASSKVLVNVSLTFSPIK